MEFLLYSIIAIIVFSHFRSRETAGPRFEVLPWTLLNIPTEVVTISTSVKLRPSSEEHQPERRLVSSPPEELAESEEARKRKRKIKHLYVSIADTKFSSVLCTWKYIKRPKKKWECFRLLIALFLRWFCQESLKDLDLKVLLECNLGRISKQIRSVTEFDQ